MVPAFMPRARSKTSSKTATPVAATQAPGANRIATYVLFLVAAAAPLPFGSPEPSTIAFWCILLGIGVVSASVRGLGRPQQLLLLGVGLIVLCYGFVLHEQLSDRPFVATPHPLWAEASPLLGGGLIPSVSIAKYEPFYSLGAPLAAVLALTLGLVVGSDRSRARQLLLVVGWSGVAYACYGILSTLVEPTLLLWREKRAYVGNVTGPFVNRNTAATYFGSCAVDLVADPFGTDSGAAPRGPAAMEAYFATIFVQAAQKCGGCLFGLLQLLHRSLDDRVARRRDGLSPGLCRRLHALLSA